MGVWVEGFGGSVVQGFGSNPLGPMLERSLVSVVASKEVEGHRPAEGTGRARGFGKQAKLRQNKHVKTSGRWKLGGSETCLGSPNRALIIRRGFL